VRDGRVVKGVRFRDHRDAGDIVEQATRYRNEGADELVFYDITASPEGRDLDLGWVRRVAEVIDIPFCVAGGIRTRDAAARCLDAGADKVSINSPALERPELIEELARDFGSQCVVVGIDSLRLKSDGDNPVPFVPSKNEGRSFGLGAPLVSTRDERGSYRVLQYTGSEVRTRHTDRKTLAWAGEVAERGAGEIVLNCMNEDGTRSGYDVPHTREVAQAVPVPVIASGGAGHPTHFRDVLQAGASGALAATVFHDGLIAIPTLKRELIACGIDVRP